MVKTQSFRCRELKDLIPGEGTSMEQCPRLCPTTKNKKERKAEKSIKTILSLRAVQRRGADVLPIPSPSPTLPLPALSRVVVWGLRPSSPLAFLHISRLTENRLGCTESCVDEHTCARIWQEHTPALQPARPAGKSWWCLLFFPEQPQENRLTCLGLCVFNCR